MIYSTVKLSSCLPMPSSLPISTTICNFAEVRMRGVCRDTGGGYSPRSIFANCNRCCQVASRCICLSIVSQQMNSHAPQNNRDSVSAACTPAEHHSEQGNSLSWPSQTNRDFVSGKYYEPTRGTAEQSGCCCAPPVVPAGSCSYCQLGCSLSKSSGSQKRPRRARFHMLKPDGSESCHELYIVMFLC
jgi:hypothetical protein